MRIVISDNSVLSCLAEIGVFWVLHELFDEVIIPKTVWNEAICSGAPVAVRQAVASSNWLIVLPDVILTENTGSLDPGEAAAISLASTYGIDQCLLLLDDWKARLTATKLGFSIMGTAGVVTQAAILGLVDFELTIQKMRSSGFFLSEEIVMQLRRRWQASDEMDQGN